MQEKYSNWKIEQKLLKMKQETESYMAPTGILKNNLHMRVSGVLAHLFGKFSFAIN